MHVCFDIRKIDCQAFERPVLTLGSFDGVHLGHQAIIKRLIEKSKEKERMGVVATYEPHPQSIVAPGDAPPLLTTLEEKLELLEELGVEETVVINFDQELKEYPAAEFVKRILAGKLNVGDLVVGDDHAFGKNRAGRIDLLKDAASEYNFDLDVVPALEVNGTRISSTRIRKELQAGEFAKAKSLLGHSYPISGTVIRGKGRGRNLDYPTLNLDVPPRKLLPQDGVYSVRTELAGRDYGGMLYVGPRLTFEDHTRSVEVHVFGLEGSVNNLNVEVWAEDWVREPKRFADLKHLKSQLRSDEKRIKEMLQVDRPKSIKRM
jgi:riboflavin kinase/FMN adenylyltransferase